MTERRNLNKIVRLYRPAFSDEIFLGFTRYFKNYAR
jgi:hypothetical protein